MKSILNVLKWIVLPLGMIHWLVIRLRNVLYDKGFLRAHRLPVPVISVGNIQMGGTGKTPMVIHLLKLLQEKGLRVGVLTRGYARKSANIHILKATENASSEAIGDEPLLILGVMNRGSALGIGANRYLTGLTLLAKQRVDIILLDDGMQHRRLHRDADICLIDASRWTTHPLLFPFSSLRDVKQSLRRAALVLFTKTDAEGEAAGKIRAEISAQTSAAVEFARFRSAECRSLMGDVAVSIAGGTPVAAFCGIANPEYFFNTVTRAGGDIVYRQAFGDHHRYSSEEISLFAQKAIESGAKYFITTEKDVVKLRELAGDTENWSQHVLYLPVEIDPAVNTALEKILEPLLESGLQKKK